jgi:predicted alpha/beta superfamily hydrolase
MEHPVVSRRSALPKATRRARCARGAAALLALAALGGCPSPAGSADADAGADAVGADDAGADPPPCPADPAGLDCLFALLDEVTASCEPRALARLAASLEDRRGTLPAWRDGRALFVTFGASAAVAGAFNDWRTDGLSTAPLCGSDLHVASAPVASGRHPYKLVRDGQWQLDPASWAFAFDDYPGNPDGKNSVLNTYDSGLGHLVSPPEPLCSDELESCRRFTTYLPPGYGDPAHAGRRYPALFMHDGQNLYDDKTCCFGHTGWEINVTLDAEIAAGNVTEVVVVGFDHAGAQRLAEYGVAMSEGGLQEAFMRFQVEAVQPAAAAMWRLDPERTHVAGSSLGGLISFRLALAYPEVYAGAASLSGAFWPGKETGTAMRDVIAAVGKVPVALYLDHGGDADSGADGYADNREVRDLLAAHGWERADAPDCVAGDDALCYFHAVGARHDELAWRDRSFRFLRFLFAP